MESCISKVVGKAASIECHQMCVTAVRTASRHHTVTRTYAGDLRPYQRY